MTKSDTTIFACPLIVSIPKGKYTAIQFVENGKSVKKVEMSIPFVLSLDKAKVGELPEGWSAAKTGEGPGSVWKVLEDKGGKKVLAQTSDQGPNRFFNLCVAVRELRGQRRAGRDVELLECMAQVAVDLVRRDEQTGSDLAVGEPLGDQLGHRTSLQVRLGQPVKAADDRRGSRGARRASRRRAVALEVSRVAPSAS